MVTNNNTIPKHIVIIKVFDITPALPFNISVAKPFSTYFLITISKVIQLSSNV